MLGAACGGSVPGHARRALLPAPLATTPVSLGVPQTAPWAQREIRQVKGRPRTANKQSDEEMSTAQSPEGGPSHPPSSGRFRPGQSLPVPGPCSGPGRWQHTWAHLLLSHLGAEPSPEAHAGPHTATGAGPRGGAAPPRPLQQPSRRLSALGIALPIPPQAQQSWRLGTQIRRLGVAGGLGRFFLFPFFPDGVFTAPQPSPGRPRVSWGRPAGGLGTGSAGWEGGRVRRPHHQRP